ncbi:MULTISPECIES: phage holin family protein [Pseudomonadaceae]|jgi:uncharacterized membrane protein YfcA|uniref:3TM holin n=1 Tax=Pseudomonas abyssi TaxID=170540 RepID=A0A395R3Q4_9PSED|nr:phage holin family protein [Halopseudomonas gallaeciensis]MEB3733450.1 phage holin family protein [Halopseudomonas pachastrellae]RGP54422.1 hypothetical protein ASB58_11110 [Halopseudomonas gallaeciensis]|tara:strand:- start:3019 stop:3279 length:261 start_codon:yes stop_codon:yes gene_type:complete
MLTTIIVLAYLLAALRLVCFNRNGYRYRWGVSLLASLLIGALLCAAFDQILYRHPVSPWQALLALVLCVLVYRSRGNVAALMRFTP